MVKLKTVLLKSILFSSSTLGASKYYTYNPITVQSTILLVCQPVCKEKFPTSNMSLRHFYTPQGSPCGLPLYKLLLASVCLI